MTNTPRSENAHHLGMHGYSPSISMKLLIFILSLIIKIFRIDGTGKISNNFIQLLNPYKTLNYKINSNNDNSVELRFRTGHGRLLWRVEEFYIEEPMMVEWLRTFKDDDVFCDIGANVGMYAIPAAINCKFCYAVELDPINLAILKHNIVLNKLFSKILAIPIALGDKTNIQNIFYRDFSVGDALQSVGKKTPFNTVVGKLEHSCSQLVMPLDQIFEMFNLEQPSKIKIDVDGNELSVVKGAIKIISTAREVYFEDSGLKDCLEVLEIFKNLGFKVIKEEIAKNSKVGRNLLFIKEN